MLRTRVIVLAVLFGATSLATSSVAAEPGATLPRLAPFFVQLPGNASGRATAGVDPRFVGLFARAPLAVEPDGFRIRASAPDACIRFVVRVARDGHDVALEGTARGLGPLETRIHSFVGDEPARFVRDARTFQGVRVEDRQRGVALDLRAHADGLEYDVVVEDALDLQDVVIDVEGAIGLDLLEDGTLRIDTAAGTLFQHAPATFALARDGSRRALSSSCEVLSPHRFGFRAAGRRPGETLVVDPVVTFGTYLGSSVFDSIEAIGADMAGGVYAAGWTTSLVFPTTPGAFDPTANGNRDAFVAKFSPGGDTLLFATFLGGVENDEAYGIAVGGAVTVTGRTRSADFPTTPGAFDGSQNGGDDAFVARLSTSGNALLSCTLLGGAFEDVGRSVAIDGNGDTWVAGSTASFDFPTTPGVLQSSIGGGRDAFVARLPANAATLAFSTFLGGAGDDEAYAMEARTFGPSSTAGFVAGATKSNDFPTTPGAFMPAAAGAGDGFALRIGATGATLAWSTYLGGGAFDGAAALAVDGGGATTVVGETWSTAFPATPGAAQPVHGGGLADAFVLRLGSTGVTLDYATFLGGGGDDDARGVAIDFAGAAHVVGHAGPGLAFAGPYNGGVGDGFFARLAPNGTSVADGAYIGGFTDDAASCVHVDCVGRSLVGGATWSGNVASITPGSADPTFNGFLDAFVVAYAKGTVTCGAPPASSNYGAGKPGTNGVPTLTALVPPAVPTQNFTIRLGQGLPGAVPVLFVGVTPLSLPFDGGALLVNPVFLFGLVPYPPSGILDIAFPLCDLPAFCGATVFMQAMFADPGATGFYMSAQTPGLTLTLGS